jgi:FAD/FMN-containing dehydrogenase
VAERISNWAGNVVQDVSRRVRPRSLSELVLLVKECAARGEPLKASGCGLSRSPIIETAGALVDMSEFRALELADDGQVRVGAGIRLDELYTFLAARGRALVNHPSVAELRCVGAMATGSHGSGLSASLASLAVQLQLVDGHAQVLDLSRSADPDAFAACAVGLGLMGIITEVTLQTVPAFAIEEVTRVEPVATAFGAGLLERAAQDDYHQYYWLPHTERALCFRRNRVDATPGPSPLPVRSPALARALAAACLRLGELWPGAIPSVNRAAQKLVYVERRRVERSSAVLCVELPPVFHEVEYGLPIEQGPAALAEVQGLLARAGLVSNFPVIVRFAAADSLFMSPAFGRATVYVSVSCSSLALLSRLRPQLEALFASHCGRPHWGKLFEPSAAELQRLYPESYPRFVAAMRERDPRGLFQNALSKRCFPPSSDVTARRRTPRARRRSG